MTRFLVVLDVDSTLIEDEAIELLAEEAGSGPEVAAITERAMRGELDFAASLAERVATLAGLDSGCCAHVGARIRLTAGAREFVDAVHAAHGAVAAVSGGFHELLDPLASDLRLDHHRANRLEVEHGRFTGRTHGPVVDAAAKADALRQWADVHDLPLRRTIAIGDGANDLLMLETAGLGVAFDAKPVVRERADLHIVRRDLRDALPLLGLRG
jgi:phosphoserine phosphatase